MNQPLNFPRKPLALTVAIATGATPMIASAAAGRVEFAYGQVSVQDTDGARRAVKKGAKLESGDTISTERGRAQLRFTDGSFVSLAPKTTFEVEDYNYEGKEDGNERSFFKLFRGGLRSITGAIGKRNRNAYRMSTPVATIGIRGSEMNITPTAGGGALIGGDGIDVNGVPIDGFVYFEFFPDGSFQQITADQYAVRMAQVAEEQVPLLSPEEQVALEEDVNQQVEDFIEEETGEEVEVVESEVKFTGVLPDAGVAYAFFDSGEGGSQPVAEVESLVTMNIEENIAHGWGSDPADHGELTFGPESDFDGIIGWTRWTFAGAVGGNFDQPGMFSDASFTMDDQSVHIVYGTPIADLYVLAMNPPHGGTYTLIGNTIPTDANGATGTFNSAALYIDWVNQFVNGTASVTFADRYDLAFSLPSGGTFSGFASVTSPTSCMGSFGCSGQVAGLIAGEAAERGAFGFHIQDYYVSGDFFGSAAFTAGPGPTLPTSP